MRQKKIFHSEAAYIAGILILAAGTAFMERADFGMSMVVAPAYLLHLKISRYLPFYSFGMSEYCLQAVVLVILSLCMGRFRKYYLFSFVTAVLYGFALDGAILALGCVHLQGLAWRTVCYILGLPLCSLGVAFLFHTYLPPEAYELFVKEISARLGTDIGRTKTAYDCVSCLVGILLSFLFFGFGHFEGVKLGTILCAAVNGWLIGRIGAWLERTFDFRDAFPWRPVFER